jgi:hypothetical protein
MFPRAHFGWILVERRSGMTIQVEVSPEVEARLTVLAAARGIPPEEYASRILEDNLGDFTSGTGILTPGTVEKMTEELTRGSENLPVLPPEANNRESYYEDRS